MDALARAVEPPHIALFFGALLKARIPGQWKRGGATVVEVDNERVSRNTEILDDNGSIRRDR